jgi:ammonium transporter, Amt family
LFAEHALAGIIGLTFNGLFATTDVISLDGVNTKTKGGFLDHNYKQLYIQITYICACCSYVFVVTAAIAKVFCLIPLLDLRATSHAEIIGIDDDQVRVNYMLYEDLRG